LNLLELLTSAEPGLFEALELAGHLLDGHVVPEPVRALIQNDGPAGHDTW
jgi:hypothetical protein